MLIFELSQQLSLANRAIDVAVRYGWTFYALSQPTASPSCSEDAAIQLQSTRHKKRLRYTMKMDGNDLTIETTNSSNPIATIRRGAPSPTGRRRSLAETPRRRITFQDVNTEDDSKESSRDSKSPPPDLEDVSLETPQQTITNEPPREPQDFRERTLDRFYLHDNGDRETVRLLMRGMPLPVTFGLPNTDGGILTNAREFTYLFHPLVSVFKVHPLCPFTAKERFVVFFCSVAFNFVWTAFMEYHRGRISVVFGGGRNGDERGFMFYLVKNVVTTLYAVLIRQIVICPCLYGPLIIAACESDAPSGLWNGVGKPATPVSKIDDRKLARRAQRVKKWKLRGDRGIMGLFVVHVGIVFTAIFLLASHLEGAPYLGDKEKNTPQRHHAALLIFYSEVINFWFWFVKFTPLFLVLYPIHKAQWYKGGSLADYLLCRRSCCEYKRSQAYKDPQYPRCVRPDTNKISESGLTNLRGLARGGSLSTIRRRHDRDAMLSVRRGDPDPYAMAPMPTSPSPQGQREPAWASPVPPPAARTRPQDLGEDVSVRRLSYTPGSSEDPLGPDETPSPALEVVAPDSFV